MDRSKNFIELIEKYYLMGGFQGKNLGLAGKILKEMIFNDVIKFLSFPACIIATGVRGIIRDFIKKNWFNVVITTNGTLDHDIARLLAKYYHGSFDSDDIKLRNEGILRLGNIFIPEKNYYIIEKFMESFFDSIKDVKELASYEFVWELGRFIDKNYKNKEESIIYWAYKNKIPIIIPGFYDGAVGFQVWFQNNRNKKIKINLEKDEDYLADIGFSDKKTGALILGGGISKHHTIWWNQFKGGLDYAIYITTAIELDGSLSGAQTREAISWKKIRENSKHVNVYGDITIILPILYNYLLEIEEINNKNKE